MKIEITEKKRFEFLPAIVPHHAGCLCCAGAETKLSMDTLLYQGFGGWHIERNGKIYYMEDSNIPFQNSKRLSDIEVEAIKAPDMDWRAVCFTPLHGETYQRQNGEWVLVEQNEGFA